MYTPLVTVLALPVSAPTKLVEVTLVNPASVVAVAPRLTEVEPIVTAEFVSDALPMLVRVLVAPLIDLFVSVCVPAVVTTSAPATVRLVALSVVNAPVDAVVAPMLVALMAPPPMVTLVPRPAVPFTDRLVKLPAARVVPPIVVLSIVLPVMASDCSAEEAMMAVPAALTIATL